MGQLYLILLLPAIAVKQARPLLSLPTGQIMFVVGFFGGPMFLLVLAVLGGLLVLFGVGTFLFQAGCALADVPDRGYFHALPIYSAALVVCLPLAAVLIWFAGRYDVDPNDWLGNYRIAAAVGALLLTWVLSAGIYSLLLSASLRKGLLIAALELLLAALSAALVAALVLVVLAIVQINTRTPQKVASGEWRVARTTASSLATRPSPLAPLLP